MAEESRAITIFRMVNMIGAFESSASWFRVSRCDIESSYIVMILSTLCPEFVCLVEQTSVRHFTPTYDMTNPFQLYVFGYVYKNLLWYLTVNMLCQIQLAYWQLSWRVFIKTHKSTKNYVFIVIDFVLTSGREVCWEILKYHPRQN